jgi:hypothetical protein
VNETFHGFRDLGEVMRRLGMNWGLSCTGGQEMEDVVHAWAGWPNLAKKSAGIFLGPTSKCKIPKISVKFC